MLSNRVYEAIRLAFLAVLIIIMAGIAVMFVIGIMNAIR